jgi:plastocyanin
MIKIAGIALLSSIGLLSPLLTQRTTEQAHTPATHEVKMVLEDGAYRFDPARLTIKPGDQVRFVMRSGAPHNVAFEADRLPEAVKARLAANMPNQISPLAGPLLSKDGESYTISFAGIAPGTYTYFCMPHMAMQMKGTIIVRP